MKTDSATLTKNNTKLSSNLNIGDNLISIFAQNMRTKRKYLGYSQEKLAEISNLHRNYIGGIEQESRNPSLKSMQKIADSLNTPLSALLSKTYEPTQTNYAIIETNDDGFSFYEISKAQAQAILADMV